ncbi:hypothetical protein [Halostella litorea]|uniref:hypothetical protein n=1 Tax=Halostella litorea TaxID=2528831 RepID=UPI0010925B5C|nr:hypothetical protein [Halostella litorea]
MADESSPANRMSERAGESAIRLRALMHLNRWVIVGALAAAVFVVLVVLGTLDASPLRASMRQTDPADTAFQALTTSIITGVTLVVTINQVVLSQELGPLGDQRNRMQGAMDFRGDVGDVIGAAPPPEPASFLQALVEATKSRAEAFERQVSAGSGEAHGRVARYVDDLVENADAVSDRLEGAEFGTFDVIDAALDYNYSWKIYDLNRIRRTHGDEFDRATGEAAEDLLDVLTLFGPAREHVKTLYFQWELVNLSRAIIYAAVPALAVTLSSLLYLDATSFPGATLGVDNIVLVVSGATTVALFPFLVLVSFVLRIATTAKRTLAIGSFILRETDRSETTDVD